ncbi:mutator type transposase [Tanacetum coccineum]|uniref:Mutator type transposase n=1 Tax=Tanacetum coccineum TaxID=301880 RepID=A0ABQ5H1V9_9ASTR
MVNTRTDAELAAAVQAAVDAMLPQIREQVREEYRAGASGGNPPPVTIHTWLERFNKQKPHSFEKASSPSEQEALEEEYHSILQRASEKSTRVTCMRSLRLSPVFLDRLLALQKNRQRTFVGVFITQEWRPLSHPGTVNRVVHNSHGQSDTDRETDRKGSDIAERFPSSPGCSSAAGLQEEHWLLIHPGHTDKKPDRISVSLALTQDQAANTTGFISLLPFMTNDFYVLLFIDQPLFPKFQEVYPDELQEYFPSRCRTPKSLTLEIYHGGWFTPTPSRSYIGGHVSSVNVIGIDEFCLRDLKDMKLDDILGGHAHIKKQITGNEITENESTRNESTGNEITEKHMVVHVGNSSTVDDYGGVDVQDDDLDVIDYDSFCSDLDDGIDSERRMQLRELRRIGKQKNKGPNNLQSRAIKACASRFLADHVIKSLATNPDIPMRAQLSGLMYNKNQIQSLLQELLEGCPWPGQILTAVLVDANKEIYPVAYAIVEAESKAYWCWFLNLLGEDLGIEANFNYTFISHRQKGLIQAIASVFRCTEHRYCVRHIHENMKSQFKGGVYKEMLWNAAKATSEGEFKKKMGRVKCDLLINNICEVFNRQLVDGRDQPIITCLEYIREYLMKRIVVVQKVIAKTVGPLTPSVTKMFDAIKKRLLSTMFNGMEVFYIQRKWGLTRIVGVNMDSWVCSSRKVGGDWNTMYSWLWRKYNNILCDSMRVKPPVGRPPKKRKKSNDEIASQSASYSGKAFKMVYVSSVMVNVAMWVITGKAAGVKVVVLVKLVQEGLLRVAASATIVSGQAAGARKVSSQAAGATNVSGQAAGARKVSGQAADARKASSQPSVAQSIAKKGNLWIFEHMYYVYFM